MPSKRHNPPLADGVPERDSCVVRCYAEHLEGLGVSVWMTEPLVRPASHVTVWLALNGQGLDTFDIRLLDRFMRHECRCPFRSAGRLRSGSSGICSIPGRRRCLRRSGSASNSRRDSGISWKSGDMQARRSAGSIPFAVTSLVWLDLSNIPLVATNEGTRNRFFAHDCTCVHPGFPDMRPRGSVGKDCPRSMLWLFCRVPGGQGCHPAPATPQPHERHGEHLDAFLRWLRQHRGQSGRPGPPA